MLVRIRVGWPKMLSTPQPHEVALAFASLLVPSALLAFTLALWNIAADLRWTSQFIVSAGLLSHWQVWFCMAAFLLAFARLLDRYGLGRSGLGHSGIDRSERVAADGEPLSRFP
jgi:hypothetical protein